MISIIIVGYNSSRYLDDCFKSIYHSRCKEFRVIFVDNNSTDSSVELIRGKYPQVIIISNKENTGYAGGNNLGIKEAIKLKSDYLFLVNPDTIIKEDCLSNLLKSADQKTILQPLILLHEKGRETELINTSGNYLNFLGFSYCDDYRKDFRTAVKKDIPAASGAAMFLPVDLIKKVGAFDESFFMYHEDVDLSWRSRLAGYDIKLIPEAVIWHKYQFSKNSRKLYFAERNRLRFVLKNFQSKTLALIFIPFIINEIFIGIYALMGGWFWSKVRADASCLANLPSILKQRRNNIRIVNDRELKRYLSGELNFSEIKIPFVNLYNKLYGLCWKAVRKLI